MCLICSYIQKMILDLIETFKIKVYNTKHTQNTMIYFLKYNFFKNPYFPKLDIHFDQRFPLNFMALPKTSRG